MASRLWQVRFCSFYDAGPGRGVLLRITNFTDNFKKTMQEIELKFQIPAAQTEAARLSIVAAAGAHPGLAHHPMQPLPLHAAYCDTPDHALARHKMALRVRQEGADWVQTFKGAGADAMTRLEENLAVPTPPPGTEGSAVQAASPRLDLSAHSAGVRAALQNALPHWSPTADPRGEHLGLSPLYETRFERWHAVVPVQASEAGNTAATLSQVMICLDLGQITARKSTHEPAQTLSEPLAELELELISGSPLALLHLARQWVGRHGLWLDVQSKAMKGTRLAQQANTGQLSASRAIAVPTVACPPAGADAQARRAWLSALLDACTGNWAEVARGGQGWQACALAWEQAMQALSAPSANLPQPFKAQAQTWHEQLAGLMASNPPATALLPAAASLATNPALTLWALQGFEALYAD
jgi:CYTH domain